MRSLKFHANQMHPGVLLSTPEIRHGRQEGRWGLNPWAAFVSRPALAVLGWSLSRSHRWAAGPCNLIRRHLAKKTQTKRESRGVVRLVFSKHFQPKMTSSWRQKHRKVFMSFCPKLDRLFHQRPTKKGSGAAPALAEVLPPGGRNKWAASAQGPPPETTRDADA